MKYDYIVVGAGLTGAVIARELANIGASVIVCERRNHIAGNVHDHWHESGINVHTYGPHYFRANNDDLWAYVNKFTKFYKYEPALKSLVDGAFENWPISGSYIKSKIGIGWQPEFKGKPNNFEEAALSLMPRMIYEKFVKGYTEKQWGVTALQLSADLVKRFDVREDDEPRLMRHKYQGIPENGYTAFVGNILKDIPVLLNFDYLKNRDSLRYKKLVFTGPIDEYFNYDMGRLEYRGQKRVTEYIPDVQFLQPCGQVNYPSPLQGEFIRSLEWKHMMNPKYSDSIKGTLVTKEYPFSPTESMDYEYPFPDTKNTELYSTYRARADLIPDLLICGRLGEYKYYDMDQAIARARMLSKNLIEQFRSKE
jgi:UDP-galactopyranose mutase